jgi:hypothetical protein
MAAEMGPSSPASSQIPLPLPEGVSDADLYEGPKIVPLPSGKGAFVGQPVPVGQPPPLNPQDLLRPIRQLDPVPEPPPVPTSVIKSAYPELIGLALDVLATKVHVLVALIAAVVIWGGVVYDPDPYRIVAAGAFSVLVFLPMMIIYLRSGMKGGS